MELLKFVVLVGAFVYITMVLFVEGVQIKLKMAVCTICCWFLKLGVRQA